MAKTKLYYHIPQTVPQNDVDNYVVLHCALAACGARSVSLSLSHARRACHRLDGIPAMWTQRLVLPLTKTHVST